MDPNTKQSSPAQTGAPQSTQTNSPRSFGATLGRLTLRGLAAVLPFALTIAILWWAGRALEDLLGERMLRWILSQFGADYYIPGMGLLLGFALLVTIGLLTRAWLVQQLLNLGGAVVKRVPVAKTIFTSVKDVMKFVAQDDAGSQLSTVVMVDMGPAGRVIGFQTREDGSELTHRKVDQQRVAVYLPMSYQIGGFLVFVDRDKVETLDMSVEEALRLSITAGMATGKDAVTEAMPGT